MSKEGGVDKKAELLQRVVRYLEISGIADMSLTPLATELGTSKRMLLYYFGSRENLISEALEVSRPDVSEIFGGVQDAHGLHAAAQDLWTAITVGRQHRPIRILFQLLSLATTQPERYEALATEAVAVMVDPIAEVYARLGVPVEDARARASLLVSALRGLCLDRLVTRDVKRTDAAAARLIEGATALAGRRSE